MGAPREASVTSDTEFFFKKGVESMFIKEAVLAMQILLRARPGEDGEEKR